jgi:hypothetical protein
MAHYGILREYRFEGVDDVRGADVYGVNNEKLGTIDDVIFEHSTGEIRYVIIKTGGLLSRKRIMVPAHTVEPYGEQEDKFYIDLDKERLEMLPEFNEDALRSESDWDNYVKAYEQCITEDPILYNKCTSRIITPPLEEQIPPPGGKPLTQEARESLNRDFTPQKMGKQDDLLGVASGTGKTTLQPKKASIAGKEDVEFHRGVPQREVMSPIGSEIEIPQESAPASPETLSEPGVYKLDPLPEEKTSSEQSHAPNANYGRRWIFFQTMLRERRDKVVSGCSLCGTQDKAA